MFALLWAGCVDPNGDASMVPRRDPASGSAAPDSGGPGSSAGAVASGGAPGADPTGGGATGGVVTSSGGAGAGSAAASDGPPPVAANGQACESDGDCASGHCVGPEKICCATACAKEAESTCGQTGSCDARTGSCAFYGPMTTCGAESCSSTTGQYTSPARCLGPHMCDPQPASTSCKGFPCEGTHCQMDCDVAAGKPCAAGNYCGDDHKCALQKALGEACGAAGECGSGFCVDGVCCDKACTDKCFSCSAKLTTKENGHCLPTDPSAETMDCEPAAPSTCKNTGHCDGKGGCQLYGSSTPCGTMTCSGNSLQQPGTCNGKGSCNQSSKSCQFGCSGNMCNACSPKAGQPCGGGCRPGTFSCDGTCKTHGITGPSCPGPCNNTCVDGNCVPDCRADTVCGHNGCGLRAGTECVVGGAIRCANGNCRNVAVGCICVDRATEDHLPGGGCKQNGDTCNNDTGDCAGCTDTAQCP